jgi:hypothetical protein
VACGREDGSYDLVSRQAIGESRGRGKIVLSGERLIMEGERGRGVGTLMRNQAGDLVMNIDATLSDIALCRQVLAQQLARRALPIYSYAASHPLSAKGLRTVGTLSSAQRAEASRAFAAMRSVVSNPSVKRR